MNMEGPGNYISKKLKKVARVATLAAVAFGSEQSLEAADKNKHHTTNNQRPGIVHKYNAPSQPRPSFGNRGNGGESVKYNSPGVPDRGAGNEGQNIVGYGSPGVPDRGNENNRQGEPMYKQPDSPNRGSGNEGQNNVPYKPPTFSRTTKEEDANVPYEPPTKPPEKDNQSRRSSTWGRR